MSKLVYADLTQEKVTVENIETDYKNSGRALAARLIWERVPAGADYLSEENAIVLAPGFLTGTQAPSTGRLNIGAKRSEGSDVRMINIAGPISQKIASMDIAALMITGAAKGSNTVLHIEKDSLSFHKLDEISGMSTGKTVEYLRALWGEDTSIIGIGPCGEHVLPIASIFSTYKNGHPAYYCSRGKMGDIFGYKGIKAIAVSGKNHFSAKVSDEEAFRKASKRLGKKIIENPVCGGALPAYGSITLIKMMREGKNFKIKKETEKKKESKGAVVTYNDMPVNKNCAPNCVIGCLNRHRSSDDTPYSSPAESEAYAACKDLFGIDDKDFIINLNKQCFNLGADTLEFLSSCAMLFEAYDEKPSKGKLVNCIEELRKLTAKGRIIGSGTRGIYGLYAENKALKAMMTKPSYKEEGSFKLDFKNRAPGCEDLSPAEYLYGYIAASGNLGLCLFTSFAMLEDSEAMEILADLVKAKTGSDIKSADLIKEALSSLKEQRQVRHDSLSGDIASYMPEFVKVLYRYFGQ